MVRDACDTSAHYNCPYTELPYVIIKVDLKQNRNSNKKKQVKLELSKGLYESASEYYENTQPCLLFYHNHRL